MNIADIIVLAAVIALVVLAIFLLRRSRAKGGCASCPYAKGCDRRG